MKEGRLFYDTVMERFDFSYDHNYYGGLHCGETFQAYIEGEWKHVSIEYDHHRERWYLPQYRDLELTGLAVRMK